MNNTFVPAPPVTRSSLEEFDQKHSVHGEPLPIDERWLSFEDGAFRSIRGHVASMVLMEPSANDVERLQARIEYYKERVRRADIAFKAETERLRHEALDRHIAGIEHNALHGEDALRYGRKKRELESSQRRLRELVNEFSELPTVRQAAANRQRAKSFKAGV